MKHIDEHILELFVVNAKEVRAKKTAIRDHLRHCAGCQEVAQRLKDIYTTVGNELVAGEKISYEADKHIVHVPQSLDVWTRPIRDIERTPAMEVARFREIGLPVLWRKINFFWREHPVVGSASGLAVVAAIVLSLFYLSERGGNPSYYSYNMGDNTLDVFASNGKLLWSVPTPDADELKRRETDENLTYTMIADLAGDSKNEVVSSILMKNEKPPSALKVFDSKGHLLRKLVFPSMTMNFKGMHYDTPFGAGNIFEERVASGELNLFVSGGIGRAGFINGRSPSILWRLDTKLNTIGKYWHYGCFDSYLINAFHDGNQEIAMVGSDDMDDMSAKDFQFMAIIDPEKLIGDQESSATQGFGFPPSQAELYYIKFPKTDLEHALGFRPTSMIDWISGDSIFYVGVKHPYNLKGRDAFGFDYVFDSRNMQILDVKFIGPTEQTYAKLKREGKLQGTFDRKYLENLRNSVEYWDGRKWVKKPTKIKHDWGLMKRGSN